MAAMALIVVLLALQLPRLTVDTDPENMLPTDQEARVFHNDTKENFSLHDMIIVGVVNEEHPDGVFNPESLTNIHALTRRIEVIDGVIRQDLLSLATVDNISQGGLGVVRFEWMMPEPPESSEDALAVRGKAKRSPTIDGTLVSEDGRAAGIYVPIREKKESHRIATEIEEIIDDLGGSNRYFITGLPVAEDTFGIEMFKQMGMAAPAAGLIIFLLMLGFFRSIALVTAPMIVAMATVGATMGLLIGMGFTVHIMSSMIPIFLMPIAVVDSVHILSEFADSYPRIGDRRRTIIAVMEHLYRPMLYTSLTSAAGFASLALAPIPPVRVFGVFVAIGITLAFLFTVTFIPAYVVRLSDARIAKLRRPATGKKKNPLLTSLLLGLGRRTLVRSRLVIFATAALTAVSVYGISRIQINDNPVRWFRPDHRIRVADRVLNKHFSGTYNAYLILEKSHEGQDHQLRDRIQDVLSESAEEAAADLIRQWLAMHEGAVPQPYDSHLESLIDSVESRLDEAEGSDYDLWDQVLALLEDAQVTGKFFQGPEALRYIEGLQQDLVASGFVGKSTSIADIVKTVHRELREGDETYYSIPATGPAVAQTLLSYQSSHRPHDLWHFLTPDYLSANVWLQLKSGDNKDMMRVTQRVEDYVAQNPPPPGVSVRWAGLTYLNVVWQAAMVGGMLKALLGSFVIVFLMMLVLFRSIWFGLLAMLPLSVTIAFIYGLIGLVGKDYDMPVAVLSSLTLGLSVDFAIHFIQRARTVHGETRDWKQTMEIMFSEPARAITRNAIVISIGFIPLLASPLVPYNTVGFFLAAIMIVSAFVTLVLLPSVMHHARNRIFRGPSAPAQE
jgi:predicted RND superfamily exporter protein